MKTCSIPECNRKHYANNLCKTHYTQLRRDGHFHKITRREQGTGSIIKGGYVRIKQFNTSKLQHIRTAEKALGKPLPKEADIHHIDGDPANNNPRNLVICPSRAYHMLIHKRQRALGECGNADWLKCYICKKYDAPGNMYVRKSGSGRHRECHNADRRVKKG